LLKVPLLSVRASLEGIHTLRAPAGQRIVRVQCVGEDLAMTTDREAPVLGAKAGQNYEVVFD